MINKIMKMLDIPFDEEEYEKSVMKKSDAIRECLCNNKNISGAFNELTEKDQQNVVDAFNKMQSMFDGLFGVKMRPYTAEDFKGATVSVHTSESGDECNCEKCGKSACECDNTSKSNEQPEQKSKYDVLKETFGKNANVAKDAAKKIYDNCKNSFAENNATKETSTICEDLLDELQDNSDFENIAKDVAKTVVKILKDKKNKKYVLTPESNGYMPTVKLEFSTGEIDFGNSKYYQIINNSEHWENGPLERLITEEIKKATGAPIAYITFNNDYRLNITIVLKKKKD